MQVFDTWRLDISFARGLCGTWLGNNDPQQIYEAVHAKPTTKAPVQPTVYSQHFVCMLWRVKDTDL